MSEKYPNKRPDWTDEQFEEWEIKTRAEILQEWALKEETIWLPGITPGSFLGYWQCPTCGYGRQDMIRPELGDLVMRCEKGHTQTFPMLHSAAKVVDEGSPI